MTYFSEIENNMRIRREVLQTTNREERNYKIVNAVNFAITLYLLTKNMHIDMTYMDIVLMPKHFRC